MEKKERNFGEGNSKAELEADSQSWSFPKHLCLMTLHRQSIAALSCSYWGASLAGLGHKAWLGGLPQQPLSGAGQAGHLGSGGTSTHRDLTGM